MKNLYNINDTPDLAVFDADGVEILGCLDAFLEIGRVCRWKGFGQPPFEPANGRGMTGSLPHDSPYEQGWCKAPLTIGPRSSPS